MKVRHIVFTLIFMLLTLPVLAQNVGKGVVVDYNNPKKYIIGGVKIEGTNYFAPEQIRQITGLIEVMEITVPSEEMYCQRSCSGRIVCNKCAPWCMCYLFCD